MYRFGIRTNISRNTINAVGFFVERVVAQLEVHIQCNKEAGCHTGRESHDIYEREHFVLCQVAEGGFEIVTDHSQMKKSGFRIFFWFSFYCKRAH